MIWSRDGSVKRIVKRAAMMRSPIAIVGSIEPDGTRYGFTMKACTR